ncbi:MAG TPA: sigma 54-interacting transcriptional regulator [Symbiobacteriaceae bacterium]|nr:sigma 54-interacting transcriptional regulator [Symbiobacteriaceae bacterium]
MEVGFRSPAMQAVLDLARRVAPVDATVLITGETGAGKGQLAHLLHRWSPRAPGPFQTIDCGSLPENLIESELFGYEGGAFTGATREGRPGLMELAHGGTLFLDEIGELPLSLQTRLLRFLQEKTVTRVGGRHARTVDVRILAATNADLRSMVARGRFRADLFWRLNVVPIDVPPLRQRPEDVEPLLDYFVAEAAGRFGRPCLISPEARQLLRCHVWPGNVRELENLVIRLVVTSRDGCVGPFDLPPDLFSAGGPDGEPPVKVTSLVPLQEAREELERQLLLLARRQGRSTREIADLLGVNQSTVVRMGRKLNG